MHSYKGHIYCFSILPRLCVSPLSFLILALLSLFPFFPFPCQFLPSSMGELQRTECLRSLREIVIPLAERPARGDLTGEVSHWADGYHLNVRLYEKLLLSVYDVLDEGKLTEVRNWVKC